MSKLSFTKYFLIIITVYGINCDYFNITVKSGKKNCIGEYLTEDTVAIFGVYTDVKNLVVDLVDPNGQNLYNKRYQSEVRVSLTVTNSGNHELCIKNNGGVDAEIQFEFLSGINALDASEIAKESSIKPAESSIIRLKDMSKDLVNDLNSVVKEEEKNLKANDAISSKITMVSIITLISMISVGVLETIYIKKYLQRRKLI